MENKINKNEQLLKDISNITDVSNLKDASDLKDFEIGLYKAGIEHEVDEINVLNKKIKEREDSLSATTEFYNKIFETLSLKTGKSINNQNIDEVPDIIYYETIDEVLGTKENLIRSIHKDHTVMPFSIMANQPNLSDHMPASSLIDILNGKSTSRSTEILNEYHSKNTYLAHNCDLVYWTAWLSAVGFSFLTTPSKQEIITFIIQHAEGLDPEVDKKLVNQNYKQKLGPHKLATIKRRIASLSIFLDKKKWINPCHDNEIKELLNKLTRKYGGSKPAGKAITKDILDAMLNVCNQNKLIDIRDKALLLFAWSSGGRRRSEVIAADMNDLTKTPENEYTYTIPKSKTDQDQKGHTVPINGRAAQALTHWLSASSITTGAIFRAISKGEKVGKALSSIDVYRIVKKRLKLAGYDETNFGAHSLRSGFVTEAGRKAKPLGDVMAMTTHKNVGTVMRYYQAGNVSNNSASNLAD